MASLNSFAVLEWIRKLQDVDNIDFLRELLRLIAQFLIDAEATEKIEAERYERTQERTTQRNGYRRREWDTRLGTVELKIPKLRQGSFFPTILEPRRRTEQALASVVQEAYVKLKFDSKRSSSLWKTAQRRGFFVSFGLFCVKNVGQTVDMWITYYSLTCTVIIL